MQEAEKKVKIQEEREGLVDLFSRATAEWVSQVPNVDPEEDKEKQRRELVQQLDLNYWKLDPYVRSTTYYHRVGVLTRQGDVDFKAAR